MRLGPQTVTIITPGDPTSYGGMGDPKHGSPVLTQVSGCSVQEHATSRNISDTDTVQARYRLFAPAGTPLAADGYVLMGAVSSWAENDGQIVYIVDGEPARWFSPRGSVHHIECYLKQRAG